MSARTAWDRGHLTPVNPMRFSEDAQDRTFYCVNIAPQDPYTNQNPWATVESRTLTYLGNQFDSYSPLKKFIFIILPIIRQ